MMTVGTALEGIDMGKLSSDYFTDIVLVAIIITVTGMVRGYTTRRWYWS